MSHFHLHRDDLNKDSASIFQGYLLSLVFVFSLICSQSVSAQLSLLNSNGYSGLGMVPSADVIGVGKASLAYENQIPGAIHSGAINDQGFNYNVGFGVMEGLEVTSRIATQDLHSNMFSNVNFQAGQMRDFSTSLKYRLPHQWLPFLDENTSVAVGDVDFGGAASYFSSKYAVATHKVGNLQLTLGAGKSSKPDATLHGGFGGIQWDMNRWSRLSYDQIGKDAWMHSTLYAHPLDSKTDVYVTLNNHLTHSDVTQKSWIGMGVNLPLSKVQDNQLGNDESLPSNKKSKRIRLPRIKPFDLQDELIKQGFYKAKFGVRGDDLILQVDQENFQWNVMDAAGVALGVLASTYGDRSRHFELMVSNRGLDVLSVNGDIGCVKKWLEQNDSCYLDLGVKSALHHTFEWSNVKWSFDSTSQVRPDLVISPTFVNTLGTEYGIFDIDLGANVNPVVRLWNGGYLDVNAIVPMGIRTSNFNEGGAFYTQRLTQQVSREVVHQVIDIPKINTQAMGTAGKIYQNYSGFGFETQTFINQGKVRMDLQGGEFKDQSLGGLTVPNKYALASLRYSIDNRYNATTEVQGGKYWLGDKGIIVTERFWYGDTALNFYLQRSRQLDSSYINFAGFQLWIPLTPRANSSFDALNIRGTNQFTFTADSKIGSTDNKITSNVGVVPKMGDTLIQLSNQDRNSDRYYELRRERLKQAYLDLRVEDRKSWVFD